jgi:CheY-like chemotaxis protein
MSLPTPGTYVGPVEGRALLLAEDNPDNAEITCEVLLLFGYRVVWARDGLEALEFTAQLRPELILMDWHMPNLDGLEATRKLKADPARAGIPVIFVTAFAMEHEVRKCLESGAVAHVPKPVDFNRLSALIEQHLPPAAAR